MALTAQLINPSYGYVRGGAATVSCTLNVLADDGITVLSSTGLSYVADLTRADFRELVTAELARQAQEYIDQLKVVAGMVYVGFGTPDFSAAVDMIMADTTSRITV